MFPYICMLNISGSGDSTNRWWRLWVVTGSLRSVASPKGLVSSPGLEQFCTLPAVIPAQWQWTSSSMDLPPVGLPFQVAISHCVWLIKPFACCFFSEQQTWTWWRILPTLLALQLPGGNLRHVWIKGVVWPSVSTRDTATGKRCE